MRFEAFGLIWEADAPLPFAPASVPDAPVDVHVSIAADQPLDPAICTYARQLTRDDGGWTLRFTGAAGEWLDYRFNAASQSLAITTSRRIDQLWAGLEGLVPAILLRDRGAGLLHGSVLVRADGFAVALLGGSGFGKSTLAARLCQNGWRAMTDDLIAFDRAEPHCVLAGSSRIGLLADAAAALPPGGLVAAGRREASGRDDDKILVRAPGEMPGSASLGAIIILQPFGTEAARLHRLTGATALAALRANSYGDWIAPRGPAEAAHLLALKAAVPVHALERPRDLSAIDACVALIAAL